MARRRYLSTDAGRDKALMEVARSAPLAASFYLLGIPAANDDCTLPAQDPDELLWEVWPAIGRVADAADVAEWITLLVEKGLWQRLTNGTLRYPPKSFYRYQTYVREDRRCRDGRDGVPAVPPVGGGVPDAGARGTPPDGATAQSALPAAQISANQRKSLPRSRLGFVQDSKTLLPAAEEVTEGVQGEPTPIAPATPDASSRDESGTPVPAAVAALVPIAAPVRRQRPAPNKLAEFADLVRAAAVPYEPNAADGKALKLSQLTAAQRQGRDRGGVGEDVGAQQK